MARSIFNQAEISALHTVLGSEQRSIDDDLEAFGGNPAQLARIKKTIGLDKRRVAPAEITALDLCEEAARALPLAEPPDALICVTQSPDHFQPANAAILHGRLGLGTDCAAFDVNLGCSGWVYGLYLAFMMIECGGCERVLLTAGDTLSHCIHPRDRATAALFGDAGSAALITRAVAPAPSHFILNTRGSGAQHIRVPAGAFRRRPGPETREEITDADGNTRCAESLHMDGAEVFNFSIGEVPAAVRAVMDFAAIGSEQIDAFAFHQANRYIITSIARRLKLPPAKVPADAVGRYGNLSSASIPAVLCDDLAGGLREKQQTLLLCGFGVGLSWASCILHAGPLAHCQLSVSAAGAGTG